MENQPINGAAPLTNGVPPGARLLPVPRAQAIALRALVGEITQTKQALDWLAGQVATESKVDVNGMTCGGMHDEAGQTYLIFVPAPAPAEK